MTVKRFAPLIALDFVFNSDTRQLEKSTLSFALVDRRRIFVTTGANSIRGFHGRPVD
jgi:hypothetical protein